MASNFTHPVGWHHRPRVVIFDVDVDLSTLIRTTMSKKRPGVDAAIQLSKSSDPSLWMRVAEGDDGFIDQTLQERADDLAGALRDGTKTCLTKSDLLDIVIPWKFAVGKSRNALLGLLRSNSNADVAKCTSAGISRVRDIKGEASDEDISKAVGELTELKGVGPAGASVILSMVRPDLFCYMYDEVIDCFLPKRTYTLKVYMTCNEACIQIARNLKGDWNPAKVARTLWIAARASANGKNIITDKDASTGQSKRETKTDRPATSSSKRQRRK